MKKYIVLCLIVFFVTGCSATININIDSDKINEDVEIIADNQSEYNEIVNWNGFPLTLYYDQILSNPFSSAKEKESGVPYYNTSYDGQSMKTNIRGNFTISNHTKSSVVRNCFNLYNITSDEDTYIFSTSKGVTCSFHDFDINITTPYKIVSHNANRFDSYTNTLVWNINESNYKEASIYLEIDFAGDVIGEKSDNNTNSLSPKTYSFIKKIVLLTFIILVIVGIVFFVIKLKKKESLSEI